MDNNITTNLSAIKSMSLNEMVAFLDYVYTTGLNNGIYATKLPDGSDEEKEILDICPYNEEWLSSDAEDATRYVFADDGDAYLPESFVKATLRLAGIDYPDNTED